MLHQHLDGVEQRQLLARRKYRLIHRVVAAKVARMAIHNRLAQLRNPRHHGIAREIGLDGCNRRVLDVLRSRKMRLPRPKIHQVHTRRPQLRSLGSHSHRRRNLNPTNPVSKYLALTQNRSSHITSSLQISSQFPTQNLAEAPEIINDFIVCKGGITGGISQNIRLELAGN